VTAVTDEVQRFGGWRLIGYADQRTLKRAICRCDCGAVRELSSEALAVGQIPVCEVCVPPLAPNHRDGPSFARDAAQAEGRSARKRHFGVKYG
jgi:hypothetical protein